jgi:hypothetical protein
VGHYHHAQRRKPCGDKLIFVSDEPDHVSAFDFKKHLADITEITEIDKTYAD